MHLPIFVTTPTNHDRIIPTACARFSMSQHAGNFHTIKIIIVNLILFHCLLVPCVCVGGGGGRDSHTRHKPMYIL